MLTTMVTSQNTIPRVPLLTGYLLSFLFSRKMLGTINKSNWENLGKFSLVKKSLNLLFKTSWEFYLFNFVEVCFAVTSFLLF